MIRWRLQNSGAHIGLHSRDQNSIGTSLWQKRHSPLLGSLNIFICPCHCQRLFWTYIAIHYTGWPWDIEWVQVSCLQTVNWSLKFTSWKRMAFNAPKSFARDWHLRHFLPTETMFVIHGGWPEWSHLCGRLRLSIVFSCFHDVSCVLMEHRLVSGCFWNLISQRP